jgi:hypothetical protein
MLSGVWRCTFSASLRGVYRHRVRIFANSFLGLALGLAAAGCSSNGYLLGPLAAGRTATIAIESIEGPPPALTNKLAANLREAAEARQLAIVAREDQANYRVRGYISTHIERGKTSIAWVWDIYGADMRRVARLTGEEPSGSNVHEANVRSDWGTVDDRVLRRIAQSGMDRILVFLNSSEAAMPASATGAIPRSLIPGGLIPVSEQPPS